jgi:hypothetical protein
MKNSNVILAIENEYKVVLKLKLDQCLVIYYEKSEIDETQWVSTPDGTSLTKDEAIKAARAILDYYDEY